MGDARRRRDAAGLDPELRAAMDELFAACRAEVDRFVLALEAKLEGLGVHPVNARAAIAAALVEEGMAITRDVLAADPPPVRGAAAAGGPRG